MGITELLLLAVGLSMDAFAVSVCKGLAMEKVNLRRMLLCGLWFGGFQALMPAIGYVLGTGFETYMEAAAPWVAFFLLAFIGGNMIRESRGDAQSASAAMDVKTMLLLAVATSIDALAVGVTFACVPVRMFAGSRLANTMAGVGIIGAVTFFLSAAGVRVGNAFGAKYGSKAELAGGVILIVIGLRILMHI